MDVKELIGLKMEQAHYGSLAIIGLIRDHWSQNGELGLKGGGVLIGPIGLGLNRVQWTQKETIGFKWRSICLKELIGLKRSHGSYKSTKLGLNWPQKNLLCSLSSKRFAARACA